MKIVLTIVIAYLIGSFSPAYFLGRVINKKDIREYGSGNAGSTNALRVFGKKVAALTLIMDVLKGVIAITIGRYIMGVNGGYLGGLFVVLGHNWPIFLKFKGGKGIATSLGVLFTLNWKLGLACLTIGLIFIIFSKQVSLGSVMASIAAPLVSYLLVGTINDYLFVTTMLLALLSIYRHRSNIGRLIRGEESKLDFKNGNKDR